MNTTTIHSGIGQASSGVDSSPLTSISAESVWLQRATVTGPKMTKIIFGQFGPVTVAFSGQFMRCNSYDVLP